MSKTTDIRMKNPAHPGGFVNREGRVHDIVKKAMAMGLKNSKPNPAEVNAFYADLEAEAIAKRMVPGRTGDR